MAEFIPRDKLSKKARKELARRNRKIWGFRPVTRVVGNKKHYDRKKIAHVRYDDTGMGDFFCRVI